MLATAATFAIEGVQGREITVEVDLRQGLPAFAIVGLPDTAVREARERVRAALLNSGLEFPQKRVTANLAPAYLRKSGATFDLALAVALLAASGQVPADTVEHCAVCGELSLGGELRRVGGAVAIAAGARSAGFRRLIVPMQNAPEAALVGGIEVLGVPSLSLLVELLHERWSPEPARPAPTTVAWAPEHPLDLADVRGQADAKRALELAAAGGHSLLMIGPPGAGKTMLARRLPGVLPPPSFDEAVEITNVHSIAGLSHGRLLRERPFRAPHHSISASGLVGGGAHPRPGEITLAHRGVLFLDELAEFPRSALEALRQPLEDGEVAVTRGQRTVSFPAAFLLVAASNPCPCGAARGSCTCGPVELARYRRRLSGPLLDRIDITCELAVPAAAALIDGAEPEETSAKVRARVIEARERQRARLAGTPADSNAEMAGRLTRKLVPLDSRAAARLAEGHLRLGLSGRAYDRILRVARTIADLAGRDRVEASDIDEALGFRTPLALEGVAA